MPSHSPLQPMAKPNFTKPVVYFSLMCLFATSAAASFFFLPAMMVLTATLGVLAIASLFLMMNAYYHMIKTSQALIENLEKDEQNLQHTVFNKISKDIYLLKFNNAKLKNKNKMLMKQLTASQKENLILKERYQKENKTSTKQNGDPENKHDRTDQKPCKNAMKLKDFSNNILKPSPETISDKNVFQHFSSEVEKIKDKINANERVDILDSCEQKFKQRLLDCIKSVCYRIFNTTNKLDNQGIEYLIKLGEKYYKVYAMYHNTAQNNTAQRHDEIRCFRLKTVSKQSFKPKVIGKRFKRNRDYNQTIAQVLGA